MARRNLFKALATSAAMTAFFLMPGVASASGYTHPANNEAGIVVHSEHFKSTKSRSEVRAEAKQAVVEGGDSRLRAGKYPSDTQVSNSGKTRQQVIDELMKESPDQRESREQAMAG